MASTNSMFVIMCTSVYDKCTLRLTKIYNVDANLDASDNVILGNDPSSEMLTSQSQKLE